MEKLINDLDNKISKAQNITGNLFNDLEEIRNSFNNLKAAINYTHSCESDSEQLIAFAEWKEYNGKWETHKQQVKNFLKEYKSN